MDRTRLLAFFNKIGNNDTVEYEASFEICRSHAVHAESFIDCELNIATVLWWKFLR